MRLFTHRTCVGSLVHHTLTTQINKHRDSHGGRAGVRALACANVGLEVYLPETRSGYPETSFYTRIC